VELVGYDGNTMSARDAADAIGVSDYCRPEDAELIGPNLYFAMTTTRNVLQIPVNTETPIVTEYAGINTNMSNESDIEDYGLASPDNLASDNAGNLYIVEDNSPSDVWVASPDHDGDGTADGVSLFVTLTTPGAEGTGIYFPRTMPRTMLINVQHAGNGNDMTMAVTKD
jgi:secreted PhoX family phosphatase